MIGCVLLFRLAKILEIAKFGGQKKNVVLHCTPVLDKPEFVDLSDFILQNMNNLQTVAFVPLAYDPVANRNDSEQKLKEVKI